MPTRDIINDNADTNWYQALQLVPALSKSNILSSANVYSHFKKHCEKA